VKYFKSIERVQEEVDLRHAEFKVQGDAFDLQVGSIE